MKHLLLLLLLLPIVVSQHSLAAHHGPHVSTHLLSSSISSKGLECAFQNNRPIYSLVKTADKGISEKQAADIAKRAYGGSVIKVSRSGRSYRVKLLKDGRVRIVKVDAITGKIAGKK